jgi:hypothetical protein
MWNSAGMACFTFSSKEDIVVDGVYHSIIYCIMMQLKLKSCCFNKPTRARTSLYVDFAVRVRAIRSILLLRASSTTSVGYRSDDVIF